MRKRCFIIAAIALVIGAYNHWCSYPDDYNIETGKRINEVLRANAENDEANRYLYRARMVDPYEIDAEDAFIGNVSLGLAGVLLLVGFIIGPPKKEVVSKKDQSEISG